MSVFEPAYLALHRSGELEQRARRALDLLGPERCVVCPRECKVDRLADRPGLCRVGRQAVVASHFAHFGEENCLRGWRGSGTIFFSGCNLRCVFCLPPGSLIATEKGPRPIEAVFEEGGDDLDVSGGSARPVQSVRVYTVTGEQAPVSKAFRHWYEGELIRLKPMSAPEVRLTPNHGVFVAHRSDPDRLVKAPAGSLTDDHYLVVPKRITNPQPASLDVASVLSEHVSGPVRRRERRIEHSRLVSALTAERTSREIGQELGYHPTYVRRLRAELRRGSLREQATAPRAIHVESGGVRFAGEHSPGIPALVSLDEGLAWLLGFYCAEGHVNESNGRPNSHRLIFSTGKHERALARRVSTCLSSVFGVRPALVERRTTNTVEAGKTSLALLFSRLCGKGATAKRVPSAIFEAPESVARAFLEGYLAGDGTETPTHRVANTVSRELAHGLYDLGLRLGVLPSIHLWRPPRRTVIEGRNVRQSPLWYVKFKRDRLEGAPGWRERTRWRDAGTHFLVPIHRIEREQYEGDVYNLEVDHDSHSYLAPAVAVANCQNHDISWQLQGERTGPERLAQMMLELQALGCHNINWVTPEHVVPQILESLAPAVEGGLRLPIIYNTSSYDSLDSLELMAGIVDVYMPDFKLWSSDAARRYLAKRDYSEVARKAVAEMHRQVGALTFDEQGLARRGLLVRHLVMPGLVDETERILTWIAEELGPDTYVDLMAQYYPAGRTSSFPEIDRHPYREELDRAYEIADRLGLRRLDARSRSRSATLAPASAAA